MVNKTVLAEDQKVLPFIQLFLLNSHVRIQLLDGEDGRSLQDFELPLAEFIVHLPGAAWSSCTRICVVTAHVRIFELSCKLLCLIA